MAAPASNNLGARPACSEPNKQYVGGPTFPPLIFGFPHTEPTEGEEGEEDGAGMGGRAGLDTGHCVLKRLGHQLLSGRSLLLAQSCSTRQC